MIWLQFARVIFIKISHIWYIFSFCLLFLNTPHFFLNSTLFLWCFSRFCRFSKFNWFLKASFLVKLNFVKASFLFNNWFLCSWTTNHKLLFTNLFLNLTLSISFWYIFKTFDPSKLKINSTLLSILFTFCPQEPDDLENRYLISSDGITNFLVIFKSIFSKSKFRFVELTI